MKTRILCALLLILSLASCGEYNKVLKGTDPELKYTYAKKYFDEKKYGRTITLLEEVLTYYTGLSREEEILFMLGQAYFFNKEYEVSTTYYTRYYNKFPKGNYTELARFNAAEALYLDSPQVELDQTSTVGALQGFQNFLEYYPQSDKAEDARKKMFELHEKMALKEYMAAQLYFHLGLYLGNNYEACVVTAREALKRYPFSEHNDDFQHLIVQARHELASQSIESKKPVRYRELLDEYYNYLNMFPKGKHIDKVVKYYDNAQKYLENDDPNRVIGRMIEDDNKNKLED